jgi:hypothetical protein
VPRAGPRADRLIHVGEDSFEKRSPVPQRQAPQRPSRVHEDVERVIDDGSGGRVGSLKQVEAGTARVVQRDDFAVEDGVRRQGAERLDDGGEPVAEVAPA